MEGFKSFLIEAGDQELNRTLKKIPKGHRALVRGFSYSFKKDHTLDGDHIGELDHSKRKITVAAPWNYGREYAVLHEIGHRVWEDNVTPEQKKQWVKIISNTKHKQNQNAEELFCMAYANTYAKNKVVIHDHPEWEKFVLSVK